MSLYIAQLKYHFEFFKTYPYELITDVLFRFVIITLHSYFLHLVIKDLEISVKQIVAYFLIADGLVGIVMSQWGDLSTLIGRMVRDGSINTLLARPITLIPYLYVESFGKNFVSKILNVIQILLGIILSTQITAIGFLLFIPWIIIALLIGLAINLFDSVSAIYMTENSGFRSGFYHFIRIFSGSLIPLYIFPVYIFELIKYSPFPMMIYYPAQVLTTTSITPESLQLLFAGALWVIILVPLSYFLWRRALRSYDAVGA